MSRQAHFPKGHLPVDRSPVFREIERICGTGTPRLVEALLHEAGFDPEAYRRAFPDLADLPTDDGAIAHFLAHGVRERRNFPIDLDVRPVRELDRAVASRPFLTELKAALCQAYGQGLPPGDAGCLASASARLSPLRPSGCRPFVLIGDSHSHVFRRSTCRGDLWLTPLHLLCSAGSAGSLANPASRSGYGGAVAAQATHLAQLRDPPPILVQFGQVDVEFVSSFQRVRDGRHRLDMDFYHGFCDRAAAAYTGFLARVFGELDQVSVLAIFPPALSDGCWASGYVNAHVMGLEGGGDADAMRDAIARLEIPSQQQRTQIHRYFNERVAEGCDAAGLRFIDVFTPLLKGAMLDPRYVPETRGSDHHLEYAATAKFAEDLLFDLVS